ncbi:Murein DD-endopeptidase MepM and murein hydrolase activator NlpD, contain LysM domain [Planifilum fulgidum]|uniref:Murein DD-endopeptidase MepM and murein hydrolase activator NlpD, contain LysM domain n=1 Tax=Planifilum fulgidum TaxID=201973 RepID=A0A1I2RGK2_9BACL|nr:peptidoglycan DD-metalloendopeptidase family protein [Planifilum fulgidum]SFG37001.1 Murein DD-endopeptidase MepM and murein hydrolase activator NlpD, contain LysM domain [Planifilum fulgidum]
MKQVFTVILAVCLTITTAGLVHANEKDRVKQELEKIQEDKSSIKKDLDKLDEDIKNNRDAIRKAEKEMIRIDKEIAVIEENMEEIKKEEEKYKKIFKNRIRKLYQQGEVGYMVSLLESKSFGEFLARFESIRLIAKRDHSLFDSYARLREKKEKQVKQLQALRKEQEKVAADAEKAYKEMLQAVKEKKGELAELESLESIKEAEIRRINLRLIQNNQLSFPYEGGPLSWPSASKRVTSTFGMRSHPVRGGYRMHSGIDIGGSYNTPIYAAASGVVVESRSSVGYGWIIVIYHGNKDGTPLYTWYAHSYPHQVRVQPGDEVKRGQHISGIGSYGMSTGNHLHFEVRIGKNGQAVNPMSYLKK